MFGRLRYVLITLKLFVFKTRSKNISVTKNTIVGQLRLMIFESGYSILVFIMVLNKYANVKPRTVCPRGIFENIPEPNETTSQMLSLFGMVGGDTIPCAINDIPAASNKPTKYTMPFRSLLNMDDIEKKRINTNGDNRKNNSNRVAKVNSILFCFL